MKFREVPIGAAFDVRNGATHASSEERYWDGSIPWVIPADLGALQGREVAGGSRAITPEGFASCGTQMVPAGSIILSTRAPVGHIAIAKNALCFNQGCRGLIPRRIIRTDFAYWSLLSRKPQLEAAGQGTTFIELGRGKLRAERISIPDLEVQKIIADFLDRETARIDQLIDKKLHLRELLREKRVSTISDIIEHGTPPGKLSRSTSSRWFDQLPEGWGLSKLKWLVRKIGDGLHSTPVYTDDGQYHFINGNNLVSGRIVLKENTQQVNAEEYNKYAVEMGSNTVLLSINGTIGNTGLFNALSLPKVSTPERNCIAGPE